MKKKEIILICKGVIYYCQNDESAFFEWIGKMKYIEKFSQQHDELYLHLPSKKLKNEDLDDIIGFFYRFKIKRMDQLAIFLNKTNKNWFFDNQHAFWHKKSVCR